MPNNAVKPILVMSHSHPNVSKGGAELSAYALYRGLRKLDIDAHYVAVIPTRNKNIYIGEPEREHILEFIPRDYDHFYHIANARLKHLVLDFVSALNPRAVFAHHYLHIGINTLGKLKSISGTKLFITLHELLGICANHGQMITTNAGSLCRISSPERCAECFGDRTGQHFVARSNLMRSVMNAADGIISPSDFVAQRYREFGIEPYLISVMENGIADMKERRQSPPIGRDPSQKKWIFGYFGQINPFKGVDVLVEAADILQKSGLDDIEIRIHGNFVGLGNEFKDKVIGGHEQMIRYMGPYVNDSVSDLMNACHYIVVPSKWWENSPLVIQEAFSNGKPIICSNIGGMKEKVKNGVHGLHFQVGDAISLSDAIKTARNYDLYENLINSLPTPMNEVDMAEMYLRIVD